MDNAKIKFLPWIGAALLAILYFASLHYRGFTSVAEYEFALKLWEYFPQISGSYLPKLPAAMATLLTGALLYLAAVKLKLANPGTAPVLYLTFPPVWYLGTSASPAPALAFLTSCAAAGLLAARKETNRWLKMVYVASGAVGAAGAAAFAQCGLFSWTGVIMAALPLIFLTWAIHLEKKNDQGLAAGRINRLAIFIAVVFLLMLVILLAAPVCRFLKLELPGYLDIYPKGERLYRPALALLAPLLWLFMVKESKHYAGKIAMIAVALGFFMLTLPPALPWNRLSGMIQDSYLKGLKTELLAGDPLFFADDDSAAAVSYCLNKPVRLVSRKAGAIHHDELKNTINNHLADKKDVVVISTKGELESFLPERSKIKYSLKNKCNIFLFTGEKK